MGGGAAPSPGDWDGLLYKLAEVRVGGDEPGLEDLARDDGRIRTGSLGERANHFGRSRLEHDLLAVGTAGFEIDHRADRVAQRVLGDKDCANTCESAHLFARFRPEGGSASR